MKTVKLGDLLTAGQIRKVSAILTCGKDDATITRQLKAYLGQFKVELEAKGVVSDYLAYVLLYLHQTGKLP